MAKGKKSLPCIKVVFPCALVNLLALNFKDLRRFESEQTALSEYSNLTIGFLRMGQDEINGIPN